VTQEPEDGERAERDQERSDEAHWKVAEAGAAEHDDPSKGERQADAGGGDFSVRVNGELTSEQVEALRAAGIVLDDVGPPEAGYGGNLDVVLTYVCVSAENESDASTKVANVLGADPRYLLARRR
jgi:hypothetical protein